MNLGVALILATGAVLLQAPQQTSDPFITTVGTGEVRRAPELAIATFGVEIHDSTAAAAAARMGQVLRRVIDTLVALGIPRDSVPTTLYVVSPDFNYEAQRVLGYEATGQVRITVSQLSQLGSLVAAALASGANHIPSIAFTVRDTRGARDEALRRAVAEARRDAETLAGAAGGRLGDLVDLSTAGRGVSGVIALDESAFEASGFALQSSAPIVPRDVPISVTVTTR